MLDAEDFTARLRDYFVAHGHRLPLDAAAFATAAGLVQTRIVVLADAWDLLRFLNDDDYAIDPRAAAKELGPDGAAVLEAALTALDGATGWTASHIEEALKSALIEDWASNRARRSAPSGSRSPGRRSARHCSSRWSCSVAIAAWPGCGPLVPRSPRRSPKPTAHSEGPVSLW